MRKKELEELLKFKTEAENKILELNNEILKQEWKINNWKNKLEIQSWEYKLEIQALEHKLKKQAWEFHEKWNNR